MNIEEASLDELLKAIEAKRNKYTSYKMKFWSVSHEDSDTTEIVLASDETNALLNVRRFQNTSFSQHGYIVKLIEESQFLQLLADAKSKYDEFESLYKQFKKKNDL